MEIQLDVPFDELCEIITLDDQVDYIGVGRDDVSFTVNTDGISEESPLILMELCARGSPSDDYFRGDEIEFWTLDTGWTVIDPLDRECQINWTDVFAEDVGCLLKQTNIPREAFTVEQGQSNESHLEVIVAARAPSVDNTIQTDSIRDTLIITTTADSSGLSATVETPLLSL